MSERELNEMVKQKIVQAKATNMLCLFVKQTILQPYSLQPCLQVIIPLDEYVILMKSMCNAQVMLFTGSGKLEDYSRAICFYDKGQINKMQVMLMFDGIQVGVTELKKAISRGRSATVISCDFETEECISLHNAFNILSHEFNTVNGYKQLFDRAVADLNKLDTFIPIDVSMLTGHNLNYFAYLVLLQISIYRIKDVGFRPFNITI